MRAPYRRQPQLVRSAAFAALLAVLVIYADPVADATRGVIALPALLPRTAPAVHWQGVLPPGSLLEVKGINGPIVASPATGDLAEVRAERTARRDDPGSVDVRVLPQPNGVTVCATYPAAGAAPAELCRPGDDADHQVRREHVRVTFHVRVPPGVHFVGRTVDGDVTATGLSGPVSLTTVNGAATFSTAAWGNARTVNGSIRAAIGRADWHEPLTLETVNGSIAVDLPPTIDADLYAHARYGETTTNFRLPAPAAPRRALDVRLGRGGRMLRLLTVNGSIRLRQ